MKRKLVIPAILIALLAALAAPAWAGPADVLRSATERARQAGEAVEQRTRETVGDMGEQVEEAGENIRENVQEGVGNVQESVEEARQRLEREERTFTGRVKKKWGTFKKKLGNLWDSIFGE